MKKSIINARLSDEIRNTGKTQKWIATQLNINQSNISDYITGRSLPALDTFSDLCQLLDLDANYILGITTFEGKKNVKIERK